MGNKLDRRHDLDALRAVAMLLGIVLHGALSFLEMPVWPVQDSQANTDVYGMLVMVIHGFRMPLFFLLSGYFTMMMWKKRGRKMLVKQRLLRIGLPMILTVVLTWVLLIGVFVLGGEKFSEDSEAGQALRSGDKVQVERVLGGEYNKADKKGMTPMAWAVAKEDLKMMAWLKEQGADLDARNSDRATPLIVATFFGKEKAAEWLLEHGADAELRNVHGSSAADTLKTDWQMVEGVGWYLKVKVDRDEWQEGRKAIGEMLAVDETPVEVKKVGLMERWEKLSRMDLLHHAWFLYYLLWLVALFVLIAPWLDKFAAMWNGARWIWLPVLAATFGCQWFMNQSFGPDTTTGLIPWPPVYLYYAVFYLFGAMNYGRGGMETSWGKKWKLWFAVSAPLVVTGVMVYFSDARQAPWGHVVVTSCAVGYVWTMALGFIGLFRQIASKQSPVMRYLSDASYWLYLAHLPVIMYVQLWVRDWPLPSGIKLLFICAVTTGGLLVIYHLAVRYTWIGAMLNGRKWREVTPPPLPWEKGA